MAGDTVILFGSAARGDADANSDVDLLILKNAGFPKSIKVPPVEIQVHTKKTMLKKAENGDLFAMHIAFDGVPISDPDNFFLIFKEACQLKVSYESEKNEALILGGFLQSNWSLYGDLSFVNKRIAWCVRTILIALAAEERKLIFSPRGLCDYALPMNIEPLLELRRSNEKPSGVIPLFDKFLKHHNGDDYLNLSKKQYAKIFSGLGNCVAKSTYLKLLSDGDDILY